MPPVLAEQTLAQALPAVAMLPFVGLLASIAVLPLVAGHWWERRRNQALVVMGWSAPVVVQLIGLWLTDAVVGPEAGASLLRAAHEYLSFVVLLGALYVISGGVLVAGNLQARPSVNTAFLAVGALLANVVGTTGASMLLIHPLLRANRERELVGHIPIFFIFIVANIGGALSPIGDPPLFVGYLRGVPFSWPLIHLGPAWLLAVSLLLSAFYLIDRHFYARERVADLALDAARASPLRIEGQLNILLLIGVMGAVLWLSPDPERSDLRRYPLRELSLIGLSLLSLRLSPPHIRPANGFSWGPIREVALLFAGIFSTMVPALIRLEAAADTLGPPSPLQLFWVTGLLSSFLDNAPAYMTFSTVACGSVSDCTGPEALGSLAGSPVGAELLKAIALGAVFMGANTYIGNGPNFMVRAIALENGYRMPSFFGYIGWSMTFLLPLYLLISLVFFW